MGLWLRKMEQKYGKFAIQNITLYLIICYGFGYVIQFVNASFLSFLTLNPYAICHGQIWRLVTWIIVPPDTMGGGIDTFFTLIMLYFYYSIGMTLERTWGTFVYNFYLFLGMIMTIIGAFVVFAYCGLTLQPGMVSIAMTYCSTSFSTYYICMSIILAFAMTFPNSQVLLFFVIPIKIKWLGIIYAIMLGVQTLQYAMIMFSTQYEAMPEIRCFYLSMIVSIVFSLLNFIIFFVGTRKSFKTPTQIKRQKAFKKQTVHMNKVSKHKCAICGRTSEEYQDLEFRFCSKCNGNYEYCSDHLFTHKHIE